MIELRSRRRESHTIETRFAVGRWSVGTSERTARAIPQLLGLAGLAGLSLCFVLANASQVWLYRGGFLLVAAFSAVVVRAAASPNLAGPVKALGWEPLRRIGLISYGLYLWHWPVFLALSPTRTGLDETPLILIRFATTFVLATCSFLLVENPIRRGALRKRTGVPLRSAVVASSVAAVLGVVLVGTSGATPAQEAIPSSAADMRLNDPRPDQVAVLLAGDDSAHDLGVDFPATAYPREALSMTTMPGCGLSNQTIVVRGHIVTRRRDCDAWRRAFSLAASRVQPDVVVLATGTWEVFDHVVNGKTLRVGSAAYADDLEKRYDSAIAALAGSSRPVTILNVPCYSQRHWDVNGGDLAIERNEVRRQTWVNGVINQVASHHPGQVQVANLRGLLCPGGRFQQTVSGVNVRPDGATVTRRGGELIWRWLMPQLEKQIASAPAVSAFIVGDSVALGLREDFPFRELKGLRVRGSTYLGCGLPHAVSFRGVAKLLLAECPKWSTRWHAEVRKA